VKDTVEVNITYPNGHGALRMTIRNDRTGTAALGNYDCEVFQKHSVDGLEVRLGDFRMERVRRWLGIEFLVSLALEMIADHQRIQHPAAPAPDTVLGGSVASDETEPEVAAVRAQRFRLLIQESYRELKRIEAAHPDLVAPLDLDAPVGPNDGGAE
jgi:hypothetical protein